MGPDEIGYKVEYEMSSSGSSGSNYLWTNYCIVNGIVCDGFRDSVQDDEIYGETRYFYIEKDWLDTMGISEVHSLRLKFDIGKQHNSSVTPTAAAEVILYPGEKDDTPYVPVLPEGARTIYEDENVKIILMNGVTYYYEGNLSRQNYDILYLRKSNANMNYSIYQVKYGELYTYVEPLGSYRYGIELSQPGDGVFSKEVWNTGANRSEWNQVDLSDMEVIIQQQNRETHETSEISVKMDMTLPEDRR